MRLSEFLLKDVIIKSETETIIDARNDDEDWLYFWLEEILDEHITPDDTEDVWIIDHRNIKTVLTKNDYYLAKKVVLSALIFKDILPNTAEMFTGTFYIQSRGGLNIEVKM